MKILAINLLRLGDIALCAPALRGLRERHPRAEICAAINRQCAGIAPLLPYVDRFVEFDREEIQRGLGEADRSAFEPRARLSEFARDLEGFDLAVNFTHTRLSGHVAGLARADRTIGLCIDLANRARIESPWFGALDEQAERFDADALHFRDLFSFGAGGDAGDVATKGFVETARGREEASVALAGHGGPWLAVQALTSDPKKNWRPDGFASALASFSRSAPEAGVALVGAEFERASLERLADAARALGARTRVAIVSFEGLYSVIKRSRLLIAGDTSALHVAGNAGTPALQLSLGGSDWRKTGAWSEGSAIIQPREFCAPCGHSQLCSRASHACGDRLPAEVVAAAALALWRRDSRALGAIANAFDDDVDLRRTESPRLGFFMSSEAPAGRGERARQAIRRAARLMTIGGARGDGFAAEPFGEWAQRIAATLAPTSEDCADLRESAQSRLAQIAEIEACARAGAGGLDKHSLIKAERLLGALRAAAAARAFDHPLTAAIDRDFHSFGGESTSFARARRALSACARIATRLRVETRLADAVVGSRPPSTSGRSMADEELA